MPSDPTGAAPAAATDLRALIGVLDDPAARERLISQLEAIVAAGADIAPAVTDASGGTAPATAPHPAPTPAGDGTADPSEAPAASNSSEGEAPPTIGDRITSAVPAMIGNFARDTRESAREYRTAAQRLKGYRNLDGEKLQRILLGVAPIAAIALGLAYLFRRLLTPVFRRLGDLSDPTRLLRQTALLLLGVIIDLLTVLAAGLVAAIVVAAIDSSDPDLAKFLPLFLASFAMSGALIVVVRAIFSPATPRLRLLPMDDDRARYWAWNLSWLVAFVAVTEIFVRELIADVVSPVTSRATMVVIYTLAAGYLIALILRNRREIPQYFENQSAKNPEDITLAILASVLRYWHWGAILYVLTLLHRLLVSGVNGLEMILTATKIIAVFALGSFLIALISQAAQRGIRLPERITRSMPALEDRLNTFVPAFLRLARLGIFIAWLAYTLHEIGVVDLAGWFQLRVGVDIVGASASVIAMLLLALIVWLAVTSWIDYRLQPRRGQSPAPRERTLLVLTRNAAAVAIVLFTLMSVLSELGISIAPLLASAGVLGLAIGFGAQKMVEDIIGGVFIQLENAFNVGDIVQAAGITGVVEELTIRSVGLRDLQGVYHVIPFSAVSTVSNFTKGFGYHVADIGIAYREDIDQAKGEMLAAFDELRADPETGAKLIGDLEWFGVEALGDSAVTLRARLKTWPGDQWAIGRAFNERVKKRFDAAGIEIPFPHLTLWFGEGKDGAAPPANLALSRATARPARRSASDAPPSQPVAVDPDRGRMRPPGAPTDADDDGAGDGMHSDGGDAPR